MLHIATSECISSNSGNTKRIYYGGLNMKTGELSKHSNEIIDKYLNQGYTTKMLTEEYNCNKSSIQRLLNKHGVSLRNSRYAFDQDFFENIDTEHKAYWLGFMYADGYVSSTRNAVSIRIKADDKYILEQLVIDLKSNIPVNIYTSTKPLPRSGKLNTLTYAEVMICNGKIKSDLIKHGCIENKSQLLTFPELEPRLIPHFIRGYMDGDGSITYSKRQKNGNRNFKVNFCGTYEFLTSIQALFGYTTKLNKRWKDDTNNYSLDIAGNIKALDFLDTIYKDSTIHLKRKHDRYLELKQQVPSISDDTGNNLVNCGNTLRALRANQSRKLRLWEV